MADEMTGPLRAGAPAVDDRRLDAPAYHRNVEPILAVLEERLAAAVGHVIEIGCGSGQHVAAFARRFPALTWWPTDPDPAHRRSADAWAAHFHLNNVMAAVGLDAAAGDWQLGAAGLPPDDDVAAFWLANVLHITPWAVTVGMVQGAGRYLKPGGQLLIYGPFSRDGVHNADSNAAFDRTLKAQDARWGVRDISDIDALGAASGLRLADIIELPSNNRILAFRRIP